MKYLKRANITEHFVNFLTMIDASQKIPTPKVFPIVLIQRLGISFFFENFINAITVYGHFLK